MKRISLVLYLLLGLFTYLNAAIESVVINWNPGLCIESCGQLLQRELGKISELESFQMDLKKGQATLKLKPSLPFSYAQLDQPLRKVGLGIRSWRLAVTGHIRQEGQKISLISTGDNSSFTLLSPLKAESNQMNIQHSLFNRELESELRITLLGIEKRGEEVHIEGLLFDPWRIPFTSFLIVEQATPFSPAP